MQQADEKILLFNKTVGKLLKELRNNNSKTTINKFAREYDMDRGNLSKLERGIINCRLINAWKLSEALGIKFSEFAKKLEEKLGKDFTLID